MDFKKLIFRRAEEKDLRAIIQMLASDIMGKTRENPQDFDCYLAAFKEISANKSEFLMVVEFENQIIATCQLTLMRSLSLQGARRMNIESVRVSDDFKNKGIGSWMMQKSMEFAKEKQAKILQLTSNKQRKDAHRFYEKLGFVASHEGMKLPL